jgi:hypothetical protein
VSVSAKIILLGLFVTSLCGSAAQLTEGSAKERVCQFVRDKSGLGRNHFLRATRREDLEDQLFAAQVKIRGKIKKAAMFFEITENGYEVISPSEAVLHNSTGGQRSWQVAVDPTSGDLFGLGGFDNAGVDSFNALALSANARIDSEEMAKGWATFYISTVLQEQRGLLLTSETDLKRRVEDIVEAYKLSRRRPISVKVWLDDLTKSKVRPFWGINVTTFDVSFRIQADMIVPTLGRDPAMVRLSFQIAQDGRVSDQSTKTLFPLSKDTPQ